MSDSDQKWWIHPSDLKWIKALGEGGFGVVRKCYWSNGGVRAVKFFKNLSPSGIELQRKVLNQILDHSRILLPVGYGISSAGHHIIMTAFAEFGDLQAILERKRPLSLQRRVQMAVEIAEGMHYLHSKEPKVLHLDLKPANILVFRDYAVKIGDLGLAEVVEKGDGVPSEYYKGTIPYAAPEAIAAARHRNTGEEAPQLTTKTDVFSFGVLLYQMVLAGKVRTPFSAEMEKLAVQYPSLEWDLRKVRNHFPDLRPKLPPPSDDVPESLCALIERCWAPAPEDRPEFKDVLIELYSIQGSLPTGEGGWKPPPPPPTSTTRPASHLRRPAHPKRAGGAACSLRCRSGSSSWSRPSSSTMS